MSIDRKRIEKIKKEITYYDDLPEHLKLDEKYEKLVKDINKYYQEVQDNITKINEPIDLDNNDADIITKDEFNKNMKRIHVLRGQIMTDKKSTNKLTNLYLELHSLVEICKTFLNNQKLEIEDVE